jgi:Fic family protein
MLGVKWKTTPEISRLLHELEALSIVFTSYHPRPDLLDSLRRESILRSSVYSARIENIPARLDDPLVHRQVEIQNLISAYTYIFSSRSPKTFSVKLIRYLHLLALRKISPDAGSLRQEPWAIFNSAGVAVYLAPAHYRLPQLLAQYVRFISLLQEPVPVKAAVAQFVFEKIHPFADGNGRVGRLISAWILSQSGFAPVGEFEKYLDLHRNDYYQVLEPNSDCTSFIEFIIRSLVAISRENLELVQNQKKDSLKSGLSYRRQEILAIIRDHPNSSFNFIHRRFIQVNQRTLHYDLLQLQKAGLIKKLGVSRGAAYAPVV